MPDETLFSFPPPPSPDSSEWPGSPIGFSNVITRTKGRTALHNKTVDATPGLLEKLLKSVHDHLNQIVGKEAIYEHDVVIHGIRVRAITNSQHLYDFWADNWYGLDEWSRLTGQPPSPEPRIKVYAILGVTHEQEAAYYSRESNTIVFFNTSYYGQLKSWVLGAVGRILAAEFGIHSIHGACVEANGKGVLYIAPTGTGKSTSSYGLMTYPKTRFHSDDWVYVRYTYTTHDGRRVFVLNSEGSDGSRARGYKVYRWIEDHAKDTGARLRAMTLNSQEMDITLGELDLTQRMEAYAYISEKIFYLRTNLAENYPLAAFEILASKAENIPDVSAGFILKNKATLHNIYYDLKGNQTGDRFHALTGKSDSQLESICARLIAFDNARSMLDMSKVLPSDRVYTNPMEPVKLVAVMLLKRNVDDPNILSHLPIDSFMQSLLIGETPDKKREIAYNAYRAVDDEAERKFMKGLDKNVNPASGSTLYKLFTEAESIPASLQEEFELFRVMYYALRTYDLNTTLQRDPTVHDKREAVGRSMAIIARTLAEEPLDIHLSINNYRKYIE
ncbi:MAG: hypothetical protein ACYDA9_19450 [Terriglobia bacterium]